MLYKLTLYDILKQGIMFLFEEMFPLSAIRSIKYFLRLNKKISS